MKQSNYTLKKNKPNFSLIQLDYDETFLTSIDCYTHKLGIVNSPIEKGRLHLTTTSIVFESEEIKTPLFKFNIDANFKTRYFKLEDILSFYNFFVPEKEKLNIANLNSHTNNINNNNNNSISNKNTNLNFLVNQPENNNNNNNYNNNLIHKSNLKTNTSTQNISAGLLRKASKVVIGPLNINLINSINTTNENNSYSKRLSKRINIVSPKNSAINSLQLQLANNSNSANINSNLNNNAFNTKNKREISININSKVDQFKKILAKIFNNENYFFYKKIPSSEEKKKSSNNLLTDINLTHSANYANAVIETVNTVIAEKQRFETQPSAAPNNYTSTKSLINPNLKKKRSILSNNSQINKENSYVNHKSINNNYNANLLGVNNNPNNPSGNHVNNLNNNCENANANANNNNNNLMNNSNFLSNHISGYSELMSYFKENNLNLNKFSEFFYLLNCQFNLVNNSNLFNNNQTNLITNKINNNALNNSLIENQIIQNHFSNYSNSSLTANAANPWDFYAILLGKAFKYKEIIRDKIQPYKEFKNNLNFIFILQGKNAEIQKFQEDLNYVLTELINNKLNDEAKLSSYILEKRIFDFLNEKIFSNFKKEFSFNTNVNNPNLIFNSNNTNNNVNSHQNIHNQHQSFYNRLTNFSVIQEESNHFTNNLVNSNTINSNTANNNVISSANHVSQFIHRNSNVSFNNIINNNSVTNLNSNNNHPLLKKRSSKANNNYLNIMSNNILSNNPNNNNNNNLNSNYLGLESSPSDLKSNNNNQQYCSNYQNYNFASSNNPNNLLASTTNQSQPAANSLFNFNPNNIHNRINTQNNSNLADNFYSRFAKGELANNPVLNSKYKFILKATRLQPEKNQKGIFLIHQNKQAEFYPLVNNPKKKIFKFCLKTQVKFLVKYRFLYQYKAINIFLFNCKRSKIFVFETEKEANLVFQFMLENCEKIEKQKYDIKNYTNLWVDGFISNFDYLIYLNEMASRAFSDMSQYPVMPWVINNFNDEDFLDLDDESNYRDLSKPIGAQNPLKLKNFRDFYNEAKEDNEIPYFYGTHYSNPTLVIFFLARSHPLFNLRLQAGGFGPADRLFQSLKLTWETAYNPGTDVMELIPEFYFGDGTFLKNSLDLNLGKTQAGRVVGDVILPKWANNSAKDFINIMRSALESDYVSENLHNWIDLIFGFKQNGEIAAENDNLFHHITYENNINLDNYSNEEKNSLMIQILEFGQTPKQLFFSPHPKKRIRQSFLFNDKILQSPFRDGIMKFHKAIKDKEILESKYEKTRRKKEAEKDALLKEFERETDTYKNKKQENVDLIAKKESEFKSYIATLLEQNKILREKFHVYDNTKDQLFNKWIKDMKKNHMVKVEEELGDKANLIKHINSLENNLDRHKIKGLDLSMNIEDKKTKIIQNEKEIKDLKKELYELQRIVRKIPHEKQIYLNQHFDSTNDSHNSIK